MWITSEHRFANRAAFLAACTAAGWGMVQGAIDTPSGVQMDIIGPILAPATIDGEGRPVAGDVVDAGYHVNMVWHARDIDAAFAASVVTPSTPSRGWSLPAPRQATAPAVPDNVPAWKGKAVLREAGRLAAARNAVDSAGGRIKDAWDGKPIWDRASPMIAAMATALSLTGPQVDQMFRDADAIRG